MIIRYKIIEILNESDTIVDFTRHEAVKEVEFKAVPHYANHTDHPTIVKRKVNLKQWNEAKRTMYIKL